MNVWPGIESVPVRWAPAFAAIAKLTDPLPLPAVSDVMLNQATLLTAVHAHPAYVVLLTVEPAHPDPPIDWQYGAICCFLGHRERLASDRERAGPLGARIHPDREVDRSAPVARRT